MITIARFKAKFESIMSKIRKIKTETLDLLKDEKSNEIAVIKKWNKLFCLYVIL